MEIKSVSLSDIPTWILLSKEYDNYVLEIVPNLTEWYEGNEMSPRFDGYMKAKINQGEAFMVVGENDECLGIIAFSRKNNSITFFGISHKAEFFYIGDLLLEHVLPMLDCEMNIKVNIIKSNSEHIKKQYTLFNEYDFVNFYDDLENGVPVNCLEKVAGVR